MTSPKSYSNVFPLKEDFQNRLTEIEFISQNKADITLDDIFVFPNIVRTTDRKSVTLKDFTQLWQTGRHLILQGDDRSGKTTICKKLYLNCISDDIPVLLIAGRDITSRSQHEHLIRRKFGEQYCGEYDDWSLYANATLIIDDLNSNSRLQFIDYAKQYFHRIFITTSQDNYISYFRDEDKIAQFELLSVRPFGHAQQETLIKRWKSMDNSRPTTTNFAHGEIDRIEDRLNSIIHNNKIVPRYPFYILSILQAYEGFMPQGIQITAYGHCYHALIVAQLSKCGIDNEDIDSAFNFLTSVAFEIFSHQKTHIPMNIDSFLSTYRIQYVIKEGVIQRLRDNIIVEQDEGYMFYYAFAYYFFLGRFFALNYNHHEHTIEELAKRSYLRDSTLR